MKRFIIATFMLAALCGCGQDDSHQLKVISFNVRNSAADDGPDSWEYRKPASITMIEEENPDIFGLQEALADQVSYFNEELSAYKGVGVGREDGKEEGERMMIYYDTTKISLLDWGTYWLSETPDQPSYGWNAACRRTATWTKLHHNASGKDFFYVNTHLDHVSAEARKNGLELIIDRIGSMNPDSLPMILTGDFNVEPSDETLNGIDLIMLSARKEAEETETKGSFNGFGEYGDSASAPVGAAEWNDLSLDYIYYSNFTECPRFTVLDKRYDGVEYISDHYPVEAVLVF